VLVGFDRVAAVSGQGLLKRDSTRPSSQFFIGQWIGNCHEMSKAEMFLFWGFRKESFGMHNAGWMEGSALCLCGVAASGEPYCTQSRCEVVPVGCLSLCVCRCDG